MDCDFLIIGGGIAGASAGYFLGAHAKVVLIEREAQPGYHTTGRSAALYTEAYGNAVIRALTVASGPFFRAPPAGFAATALLRPRGAMTIADSAAVAELQQKLALGRRFAPNIRPVDVDTALRLCPILRRERLAQAFYEPDARDIDVNALHQGFLAGLKAAGGSIVTGAEVREIAHRGRRWHVKTAAGEFAAGAIIDAAGAWADEVARIAGVPPLGLTPLRRTVFTLAPPQGAVVDPWPMVVDATETLYFKPDAGRLLVSPADETPTPPSDVQPEEMDIAVGAARLEAVTVLSVKRIERKWAGLRTFTRDRTPAVGPAPGVPGFFWLAGQGGYGIQTAPTMGRIAAAFALGRPLPEDIASAGVTPKDLLPDRLLA